MGRLLRGEVPIGVASAVKTRRAPKCNFSRKPAEQVHHTQFSVALENAKVTLGNSHGSSWRVKIWGGTGLLGKKRLIQEKASKAWMASRPVKKLNTAVPQRRSPVMEEVRMKLNTTPKETVHGSQLRKNTSINIRWNQEAVDTISSPGTWGQLLPAPHTWGDRLRSGRGQGSEPDHPPHTPPPAPQHQGQRASLFWRWNEPSSETWSVETNRTHSALRNRTQDCYSKRKQWESWRIWAGCD